MTALPITLEGADALSIDPTRRRLAALNADDARRLTTEIQRTGIRLWLLVTEAHDRKAWQALGYATWREYVVQELKMSESRSYQLLDTGHVMRELAAAGVDILACDPPPARVVARVKDRLPEVRRVVRDAIKHDETPSAALRELAQHEPPQTPLALEAAPSGDDSGPAKRGSSTMTCPACGGEGKVGRSLGMRLRNWLKASEDNAA